jgi:hypothetical protein
MNATHIFFFILVLAMSPWGSAISQPATYSLEGIVLAEDDGTPLIGATVLVPPTSQKVFTGIDGKFVLKNLPQGQHALSISMIGYQSITIDSLSVPSNQQPIIILLKPLDICDNIEERARRDLARGKVFLLFGGLPAIYRDTAPKIARIQAKYGFQSVDAGCSDPCSQRYNAVVRIYLDHRNGPDWWDRYRKEIDQVYEQAKDH